MNQAYLQTVFLKNAPQSSCLVPSSFFQYILQNAKRNSVADILLTETEFQIIQKMILQKPELKFWKLKSFSKFFPANQIFGNKNVSPNQIQALKTTLIKMKDSSTGKLILEQLRIDHFQ
jgi:hypothetical protein